MARWITCWSCPISPFEIAMSKVWANGLVITIAVGLSLTIVVRTLLGVPIAGSVPLFLAGTALYLFFATAIGIFLGTVARSMPQLGLALHADRHAHEHLVWQQHATGKHAARGWQPSCRPLPRPTSYHSRRRSSIGALALTWSGRNSLRSRRSADYFSSLRSSDSGALRRRPARPAADSRTAHALRGLQSVWRLRSEMETPLVPPGVTEFEGQPTIAVILPCYNEGWDDCGGCRGF